MKILHFADLHLDKSFAAQGFTAAMGIARRDDLLRVFSRICRIAREHNVDALTIAGDLFDDGFVVPATLDLLIQQFSDLAPIRVFIAPGRADPYTSISPYALWNFPENVHIFRQPSLTPVELGENITIWGAAHPTVPGSSPLDYFSGHHGVNILLLHAIDTISPEDEPTFYVNADAVHAAGINFALLGYEHNVRLFANGVYPGSPDVLQPEDVSGQHGVVLLHIEHNECLAEIIGTGVWHYVSQEIDLTGCISVEQAAVRIHETFEGIQGEHTIRYITLIGYPEFAVHLSELSELVKGQIIYRCRFTVPYTLDTLAQEKTVRGFLARQFQQRMAVEDDIHERALLTNSLHIVLQALDGKRGLFNAFEPD